MQKCPLDLTITKKKHRVINHHFASNEEAAPFSVWLFSHNYDKWTFQDR